VERATIAPLSIRLLSVVALAISLLAIPYVALLGLLFWPSVHSHTAPWDAKLTLAWCIVAMPMAISHCWLAGRNLVFPTINRLVTTLIGSVLIALTCPAIWWLAGMAKN
jgi:hypothetical protein